MSEDTIIDQFSYAGRLTTALVAAVKHSGPRRLAAVLAVPEGFAVVNTSAHSDDGYDATALYNASSGELVIANHGANTLYGADKEAVFEDGGAQIAVAQKFLKTTIEGLPALPAHITLAGYSLGGVLADAQAVAMLRQFPAIPFHVILFDSIGSNRYAKDLSAEEIASINANTRAFQGDGISRDFELFHSVSLLCRKLPLGTTHLFYDKAPDGKHHAIDPLADPAAGAIVSVHDVHHAIHNFIDPVLQQARSQRPVNTGPQTPGR